MTQKRWIPLVVALAVALAACGGQEQASHGAAAQPEPIADHECGACGMIVREQPSPRGQVVHRDGTHVWLCSLADVVAYAAAPSPHGRVEQVWVETLAADVDPAANEVAQRPWARAAEAHYVLGVERDSVMGTAVLAFASAADASAAAARLGGRAASWDEIVRALGGTP
jgi:nitrous oxide reductase accessory protein NosL